jgi:hypothetical protein
VNGEDRVTLLAQLLYERFPAASAVEYEATRGVPAAAYVTHSPDPGLTARDAETRTYQQRKAAQRLELRVQAARRIVAASRRAS